MAPGRYAATPAGLIHCDGVYIGQSVRPLIVAVRHWRQALPRGHRVSALVVVHPTAEGELAIALADQQALPKVEGLVPAPSPTPTLSAGQE